MAKGPTQRTRVIERRTLDTTRTAGSGAERLANVTGALNQHFGQVSGEVQRNLEDRERRVNDEAAKKLDRLLKTNPKAAERLRKTGDYEAFAKEAGDTFDKDVLARRDVGTAFARTLGKFAAEEDGEKLKQRLRTADPALSMTDVAADFIKENSEGMSPTVQNEYVPNLNATADRLIPGFAEKRRQTILKSNRDKAQVVVAGSLRKAGAINVETMESGIDQLEEVYALDTDRVTARLRAAEDMEALVLNGLRNGQPWASAAVNVEYAGRKPMSMQPDMRLKIQDASAAFISARGRIFSDAEDRATFAVRQKLNALKTNVTQRGIDDLVSSVWSTSEKYRKGELPNNKLQAILNAIPGLRSSLAKDNVDRSKALNGGIYSDNKVTQWLMSSDGLQAVMTKFGQTQPQAEITRDLMIARQSAQGLDPEGRGILSKSLRNGDPATRIGAVMRALRLSRSATANSDRSKFYDKDLDHMVVGVGARQAGPDGVIGTADDGNIQKALDEYDRAREDAGGIEPTKGFRGAVLHQSTTEQVLDEDKLTSKWADRLGVDPSKMKNLNLTVKRALTNTAWWHSAKLKNSSNMRDNDELMEEAMEYLSGTTTTIVRRDAGGGTDVFVVPRRSNLPRLTEEHAEAFDADADSTYPESLKEQGLALVDDALSDRTKSRAVVLTGEDGVGQDPVEYRPSEKITVNSSDVDKPLNRWMTKGNVLTAAGTEGTVEFIAPRAPVEGDPTVYQIDDKTFVMWDKNTWKLRYRTAEDNTEILSAAELDAKRRQRIAVEEREVDGDILRKLEEDGRINSRALTNAISTEGILESMARARKESIKDGHLFDGVAGAFVTDTAVEIREFSPKTSRPVSRKTNSTNATDDDIIVGYSFNLQRSNADKFLRAVGVNKKKLMAEEEAMSQAQMEKLQQMSIQDSLSRLTKRIGSESLSNLSIGQTSALIGLMETGGWDGGKSQALAPAIISAIKENRYADVAKLVQQTFVAGPVPTAKELAERQVKPRSKTAMVRPGDISTLAAVQNVVRVFTPDSKTVNELEMPVN